MYQVYKSDLSFQETVSELYKKHNYCKEDSFIHIRGDHCASREGLFSTFKDTLDFPGFFADNWDSFSDCLFDFFMQSEANILIYISDFHILLEGDTEKQAIFQTILDDLGENEYAKHVIIVCSSHSFAG